MHWFSLTGSLAISLLLAGLVAAIMARTVRRDLQRYNALDETDELLHEVGWKYCHTTCSARRRGRSPSLCASAAASSCSA